MNITSVSRAVLTNEQSSRVCQQAFKIMAIGDKNVWTGRGSSRARKASGGGRRTEREWAPVTLVQCLWVPVFRTYRQTKVGLPRLLHFIQSISFTSKTIAIVYISITMIRKSCYSGMRYFCKSLTGGCEIFFGSRKHSENANSSRSGQDFKSPG